MKIVIRPVSRRARMNVGSDASAASAASAAAATVLARTPTAAPTVTEATRHRSGGGHAC